MGSSEDSTGKSKFVENKTRAKILTAAFMVGLCVGVIISERVYIRTNVEDVPGGLASSSGRSLKLESSAARNSLEAVLRKVAPQKEIMIGVSNRNPLYEGMLDTWLSGVKQAGVQNYLVVALDSETEKAMLAKNVNVFFMNITIHKSQADTGENHAVSALKFGILKSFVELGWSVLLSDIDICVLQNPFNFLYRDSDIEGMTDGFDETTAYGAIEGFDDPSMGCAIPAPPRPRPGPPPPPPPRPPRPSRAAGALPGARSPSRWTCAAGPGAGAEPALALPAPPQVGALRAGLQALQSQLGPVLHARQPAHRGADGPPGEAPVQGEVLGPERLQRGDLPPQPRQLQVPAGGRRCLPLPGGGGLPGEAALGKPPRAPGRYTTIGDARARPPPPVPRPPHQLPPPPPQVTVRVLEIMKFMNTKVLFKDIRHRPKDQRPEMPVMVHVNYHPDKHQRMKAIFKYYLDKDEHALDSFPGGSNPGS
jgi:hypothetical protein